MSSTPQNSVLRNTSVFGVAQMCSINDKDKNYNACKSLVAEAKSKGVEFLSFPECFAFIGGGKRETESVENAESLEGPTMQKYRELAKENNMWLSLGGYHEKIPGKDKIYNTHVIVNNSGDIVSTYRKMHLFDMSMPEGPNMHESKVVESGEKVELCDTPFGKLGLSICYDLRFPELYVTLREQGAHIILIPAAFTKITGEAHWKTLLQARAIETQSYVIAAAQVGFHHPKRESFGHALIVDPWGSIVAEVPEGHGVAATTIDLAHLEKVRASMPVMNHRKKLLYFVKDAL